MPTPESKSLADDPVQLDPKHFAVEFENDRVRVLRAKYGPKEKSPMLRTPDMIAIALTDRDFKFTRPDGRVQRMFGKAGEVGWYDARRHQPENMSAQPYEGILIMLKDSK
jgi:hypothetical protein